MTEVFNGEVLNPRLVFYNKTKHIKTVTGYIRNTRDPRDPALMFNVIYHQVNTGDSVGIINLVIYNKTYTKDVSTTDIIDDSKLYAMVNNEKLEIFYSKAWSNKEEIFVEDGNKIDLARPYAESVELWLNQIFTK
jgi:hypothetical protein